VVPGRVAQGLWKTLNWPPFHTFAGEADLYHFPNFTRPPLRRGRSVITVHDLAFLRLPETLEEKNRLYLQARMKPSVERADAIITVSRFTAHELTDLMGVPAAKLHAIHSGIDADMKPPAPGAVSALRKKLGLDRPYLLMVGTLEPRKNIPFLVDVFERLEKFDGDLVIAGRPGWKYEPILQRLRTSRRAARIKLIQDLGEGELPTLYGGAELFVLPSLYEGFGFPPLESMACGVPAVVAPAGAMAEVCGEAALVIPDYDADAWATAVQRLLDSPPNAPTCAPAAWPTPRNSAGTKRPGKPGGPTRRRYLHEHLPRCPLDLPGNFRHWSLYAGAHPGPGPGQPPARHHPALHDADRTGAHAPPYPLRPEPALLHAPRELRSIQFTKPAPAARPAAPARVRPLSLHQLHDAPARLWKNPARGHHPRPDPAAVPRPRTQIQKDAAVSNLPRTDDADRAPGRPHHHGQRLHPT
jgi:hypothetical protein